MRVMPANRRGGFVAPRRFDIAQRHAVAALFKDVQFRRHARPVQRGIEQQRVFRRHGFVLRSRPDETVRCVRAHIFLQRILLRPYPVPAEVDKGARMGVPLVARDDGVGKDRCVGADSLARLFAERLHKRSVVPPQGNAPAQVPARGKADGGDMLPVQIERGGFPAQIQHRHARLQNLRGIVLGRDAVIERKAVEPRAEIAERDRFPLPVGYHRIPAARNYEERGAYFFIRTDQLPVAVCGEIPALRTAARDTKIFVQVDCFDDHLCSRPPLLISPPL